MNPTTFSILHLKITWLCILAGIVSGAMMGLFFQRENWLGGYTSFKRRLLRLGHISFFGFAFLNCIFCFTCAILGLTALQTQSTASSAFIIATISMPLTCALCACWKPFYYLFAIPVSSSLLAVALCVAATI